MDSGWMRRARELLRQRRVAAIVVVTLLTLGLVGVVLTVTTSVGCSLVKSLVEAIQKQVGDLGLIVDKNLESEQIVELSVYITTLVMNFFSRRRFERRKKAREEKKPPATALVHELS